MESRPNSPLSLFDDVADLDLEDGTEDDDLLPAFAVAEREVAKEAHDAAPPRVIPPSMRERLHNAATCIDLAAAEGAALKCRLNPHPQQRTSWKNVVKETSATIAANPRTAQQNKHVWSGKPVNLLTFSAGADTLYWGRYKCVGGEPRTFELRRDDGDPLGRKLLSQMPTVAENALAPKYRSRLEESYVEHFRHCGVDAVYEPLTLRLGAREYTPDFVVSEAPHAPVLIEIKGMVVDEELETCKRVAAMGHHICLLFGDPEECAEHCFEWLPYASEPRRTLPALLRVLAGVPA